MNENENQLAQVEEITQPLVAREVGLITADDIRRADMAVAGLNKIKAISLKLTNKSDWAVFNGKPCLQNTGCMKIAGLWGVSFLDPKITETRRQDDKGEYVEFSCEGKADFRGRIVTDFGTASTRDKLLGSVGGALRPLSDVDLPSVKKMAVTNWQSRILKKILGLSFEMDDLEQAGIKLKGGVSYASGGQGGGLISEAQGKRLFAIAKSAGISDEACKTVLKGFGYASSKDIRREDYEAICKMVEDKGGKGQAEPENDKDRAY